MDYQSLVPVIGTVISIRPVAGSCCEQTLSLAGDTGPVTFIISSHTLIPGHSRLRSGMRIVAYYDKNLPVPLIYPPRYQAQLISVLRPSEQVFLGYFDRNLISADQNLRLNLSPSTTVLTANGQTFGCSPANQMLLVFYTSATRSIPPQTTPRKIIVLC